MSKALDLTGVRSGRLIAIERVETTGKREGKHARWLCQCDCGNTSIVSSDCIKYGTVKSCGCWAKERMSKLNYSHGFALKERLYTTWAAMKGRCNNPTEQHYKDYGGRGITVCKEWDNNYVAFREWALANGYRDDLSIDRIDHNGNYEPDNCRWATWTEQENNRRNNRYIVYKGETHTMAEWARIFGIKYSIFNRRIQSGWSITDIVDKYGVAL